MFVYVGRAVGGTFETERALLRISRLPQWQFLVSTASLKIQSQVATLCRSGVHIVLCWVPGHVGLPDNEDADNAAKDAVMNRYLTTCRVIGDDVLLFLRRATYSSWH
jgi:hypothetical protein